MTSIEDDRKHLGPDGVSARKPATPAPASADLDALEQAARAALDTFEAEGQWYPALAFTSIIDADDDQVFCDEDAAYIAAASPDVILRLIAAVREADALREEVAMLRAKIGAYETAVQEFRAILSATEPAE